MTENIMTVDEQLKAAGERALNKGDCPSVIVATDKSNQRNYHQCLADPKVRHEAHYCGCGDEWFLVHGVWVHNGSALKEVFFG